MSKVYPIDACLAFPVRSAHVICGVRPFHVRRAIAAQELHPVACGRRSLLTRENLLAWIATFPPTKSPKRKELTHG